jgi:hypothetical protein
MSDITLKFDWRTYLKKYPDLSKANIVTEKTALNHWNKYGRLEGRSDKYINPIFNDTDIIKYPKLFHKYLLGISSSTTQIKYNIIYIANINKHQICHFHIHDITMYADYLPCLNIIKDEFDIIVTFNIGEIPILDNTFTLLQVENRGFDIGPKICMFQFLIDKSIDYDYILFLHSKSNKALRKNWFDTFVKSTSRVKLLKCIMETNKNMLGIFPNYCYKEHHKSTHNIFIYNNDYFNEILSYLNVENKSKEFIAGNIMILRKPVIDRIFSNNLNIFYNILNDKDSFDLNWYMFMNKLDKTQSPELLYAHFKSSKNKIGNNLKIYKVRRSFPDGMIEHSFERIWLNIIKEIKGDFLVLPADNAIDKYNIKINAIYFPQFHEIPENNEFWGDKFTEWTLLKPYADKINTSFGEIPIYKPHTDIGYYDLGVKETMLKQISIAESYNINGFIIYHYWFSKDKILMRKPLEYFLNEDINFPFSISWANENWTRRWDGSKNELLIEQKYDDHLEHILYLIQFFKRPNYIRNAKNENIIYIYNISSIPDYDKMVTTWNLELEKQGLKIKIVGTNNGFPTNWSDKYTNTRYLFEPMTHSRGAGFKINKLEHTWSYEELLKLYSDDDNIVCKQEYPHFGLPLFWNKIVRRKNSLYQFSRDYSIASLERFLYVLLSKIILRYKNIIDVEKLPNYENFINVNAWNEWNEQAILEPNNITGYQNLETIKNVVDNL